VADKKALFVSLSYQAISINSHTQIELKLLVAIQTSRGSVLIEIMSRLFLAVISCLFVISNHANAEIVINIYCENRSCQFISKVTDNNTETTNFTGQSIYDSDGIDSLSTYGSRHSIGYGYFTPHDIASKFLPIMPSAVCERFRNLQEIQIFMMALTTITKHSFESCLKLRKLNLSSNNLTEITTEMFQNNVALTSLDLSSNQINHIESGALSKLTNLRILMLSMNGISVLEPQTFRGLRRLQRLNLYDNKITELRLEMFRGLVSITDLNVDLNPIIAVDPNFNAYFDNLEFVISRKLGCTNYYHNQFDQCNANYENKYGKQPLTPDGDYDCEYSSKGYTCQLINEHSFAVKLIKFGLLSTWFTGMLAIVMLFLLATCDWTRYKEMKMKLGVPERLKKIDYSRFQFTDRSKVREKFIAFKDKVVEYKEELFIVVPALVRHTFLRDSGSADYHRVDESVTVRLTAETTTAAAVTSAE